MFKKIILPAVLAHIAMLGAIDESSAEEATPAWPASIAQSIIDGDSFGQVTGAFAANVAAGDGNLQSNASAIAVNAQGGPSVARVGSVQHPDAVVLNGGHDVAVARITGRPFANAAGLIMINQASGEGNAQANGIAIALGIEGEVVAETDLAATLPDTGTSMAVRTAHRGVRAASINDTAFEGASGIVQVTQSAGSGNITANNFVLRVTVDGKP